MIRSIFRSCRHFSNPSSSTSKFNSPSNPLVELQALNISRSEDANKFAAPLPSSSASASRPPILLPEDVRTPQFYTCPSPIKVNILSPAFNYLEVEKTDPNVERAPISEPNKDEKHEIFARMRFWAKIRKHKMMKHKRRKRLKRDWFQIQKLKAKRIQKEETLFRARMRETMQQIEQFDPMEYVEDTIRRASNEWRPKVAASGRKKHPHWSQFISLEELFGVEKGNYIDKRYGLPMGEDKARIDELRKSYFDLYAAKRTNAKDFKSDDC